MAAFVVLPLPFVFSDFGIVPVLKVVVRSLNAGVSLRGIPESVLWVTILWWSLQTLLGATVRWADRFRGAIVGLCVFSCLVLFATFPVYLPGPLAGTNACTFLSLY